MVLTVGMLQVIVHKAFVPIHEALQSFLSGGNLCHRMQGMV